MKKLQLFYATWCPHCQNTLKWLDELKGENPNYENVDLEKIQYENEPEKMEGRDFYYVPTFYLGDDKIFEGVPSKEIIKDALDKALES